MLRGEIEYSTEKNSRDNRTRFGFQTLEVYQLAKAIVVSTYRVTKSFPAEERYALSQQMNRAAVSIPSNIAEGYSRASPKDKMHFMNMAYGSLMELTCQFEIAEELSYVSKEQLDEYSKEARNLAVKISNFRRAIEQKQQESNGETIGKHSEAVEKR